MDYDKELMPYTTEDMPKLEMVILLTFWPVLALLLVSFGICQIIGGAELTGADIFALLVMIASVSVYGWETISQLSARFNFCGDGLWVKYPLCQWEKIPWMEFQQICICYGNGTTNGPYRAYGVICFVKKGEKKDIYGQWKSDNVFHHRSVITVSLTEESLLKLQLACNAPIVDLRGTRIYPNPINAKLHIKLKTPEELQQIREAMKKADTEN